MGCGRNYCPLCGEELIHRDHRKKYESASGLGQIIWREGPQLLTVCDIDLATLKRLKSGCNLFRILEQKQPGHELDGRTQGAILSLLDGMIQHCVQCPSAADLKLDPRSGVFVIWGDIVGAKEGRRKTQFNGEQVVERMRDGKKLTVADAEGLWRILDPESTLRRRSRERTLVRTT